MLKRAIGRSFDQIYDELSSVVSKPFEGAIALSGRWGPGKTFLWRKIDLALRDQPRWMWSRIYVSAFGLDSIDSLQWKLLQNLHEESESSLRRSVKAMTGAAQHLAASARWSGKLADHIAAIAGALPVRRHQGDSGREKFERLHYPPTRSTPLRRK